MSSSPDVLEFEVKEATDKYLIEKLHVATEYLYNS